MSTLLVSSIYLQSMGSFEQDVLKLVQQLALIVVVFAEIHVTAWCYVTGNDGERSA